MRSREERVGISVTAAGITITAPLDVTDTELIEATKAALRKAERRRAGRRTPHEIATEMGFRAKVAYSSGGATWREVTEQIAVLLQRDNLEEKQVRRWVERYDAMSRAWTDADNARRVSEDTSGPK